MLWSMGERTTNGKIKTEEEKSIQLMEHNKYRRNASAYISFKLKKSAAHYCTDLRQATSIQLTA